MSHAELVERAERWLLRTCGCGFVLTELSSDSREIPDAIGWRRCRSYLIECKTSRSDFSADAKKPFRRKPEQGMGNLRYYMTPPGLVTTDDLPERWGLLEAYPTRVKIVRAATPFQSPKIASNDRKILCAALRRVHLRDDLKRIYEPWPQQHIA